MNHLPWLARSKAGAGFEHDVGLGVRLKGAYIGCFESGSHAVARERRHADSIIAVDLARWKGRLAKLGGGGVGALSRTKGSEFSSGLHHARRAADAL